MQLQTIRASILAAAVVFSVGCTPAATEPADGGAGTGGRGTGTGGGGAGTGGAGAGPGGAGGSGTVTYTKDVQPILKAKCAPCHTDMGIADHNIATNYADAKKPNHSHDFDVCWKDTEQTMPMTVGECSLLLIQNGRMPLEAGCGSPTPLKPEACLTAAQKAVIAAWVAAGMPE